MLGYWDSPLLLTQKEIRILIRGRLFPLADDICMDNLAVDVTGAEDIAIGDDALLQGIFLTQGLNSIELNVSDISCIAGRFFTH